MMRYWLFICLGFFIPQLGLAANPLDFTPPADDLSIHFLGNIFGIVDGVLSGSGSQILGQMFAIFNAAVLAIGGIILLYVTVVSTLNTANEGEFLGKKWSSIWIPVRAVIGVALLIPKQSGYCLMQIFVMWIVVQGVGAADKVWGAALDYMAAGGTIINENPFPNLLKQDSPTISASSDMLLAQTCLSALHRFLEETRQSNIENGLCPNSGDPNAPWWCKSIPNFSNNIASELMKMSQSGGTISVAMPNLDKKVYPEIHGICGNIRVLPYMADTFTALKKQVEQLRVVGATQVFLNLNSVAQKIIRNQFDREKPMELGEADIIHVQANRASGHSSYKGRSIFAERGEGQNRTTRSWKASSGSALLNGKEVIDAANVYGKIVEPALRAIAQSAQKDAYAKDFIDQAKTEGWILAGAYFYDLVKLNKHYNQLQPDTDDDGLVVNFDMKNVGDENELLKRLTTRQDRNKPAALTLTQFNQLGAILAGGAWEERDSSNAIVKKEIRGANSISGHLQEVKKMVEMGNPYQNKAPNFSTDLNLEGKPEAKKFKLSEMKIKVGWFNIPGTLLSGIYNYLIIPIMNEILHVVFENFNFTVDLMLGIPLKLVVDTFETALRASLEANANPLGVLAGLGAALMNITIKTWISAVVIVGMMTAVANMFGAGLAVTFLGIAPVFFSMMTAVFLAGTILAFYLPLVPYIIFLFGALAWFIGVIESMVAAPIVALGVMHPGGDEQFGKSDNAIMLILNVFLRPSMMVIGFIAGIILSYVGLWMINMAFDRVVMGVIDFTFESATGVAPIGSAVFVPMIAKVMMLIVYVTLVMTVIHKSFSLIHYVPDKVLRWLSGGLQEQLGGTITESSAQEAQGMARQAAGAASQMVGQQRLSSAQSGMQKLAEKGQSEVKGEGGPSDDKKGDEGTANITPQQKSQGNSDGGNAGVSGKGSGSNAGVGGVHIGDEKK